MMSTPEALLLEQLSANSIPYRDPLAVLDWRTLNAETYWLPPEAISLHGLPEFESLSEAAQIRLSQYELLGISQTAVAFERVAMAATARKLREAEPDAEYAFLLHEMREAAGHSLMVLRLAAASGLELIGWHRSLPAFARPVSRILANDCLYWFLRVVTQDVPDKLNRYVRRHAGGQVSGFIRQMMALQMRDEARHLAYARQRLGLAVKAMRGPISTLMPGLCDALFNRVVRSFFWPQAELYEGAGLGHGGAWRRAALRNRQRREFVLRLLAPTMRVLAEHGIQVRLR